MSTQHAPLRVRKAVLARLIVGEAVDPVLTSGTASDDVYVVAEEVLRSVNAATLSEIDAPLDDPLDTFVQGVIDEAARRIDGNKRLHGDENLPRAAAAMRARAASLCCATCAGHERPCNGETARDSAIVSRAGQCIESFRSLFMLGLEIVRIYYAQIFGQQSLASWPKVSFLTNHNAPGVKAHPFQSPAQISGATRRTDDAAEVELIFCPADFSWAGYLAAAYVLVHEALHVTEGIHSSIRVPAKQEDPFVEGWMDWIAFQIFDVTMRRRGPAAALASQFTYAEGHREKSSQLHAARFDADTSSDKTLSYRLLSGKRGAEQFYVFCRRVLSKESANRMFLEVSFLLNARGDDINTHRGIMARIGKELPAANGRLRQPLSEAGRELRELLLNGLVNDVVRWLLS